LLTFADELLVCRSSARVSVAEKQYPILDHASEVLINYELVYQF